MSGFARNTEKVEALGAIVETFCWYSSGSWVVPKVPLGTRMRVRIVGPGGSGAMADFSAGWRAATGGGGGAYAERTVPVIGGELLTFQIGAGGAAKTTSGNGNPGGTTACSGAGMSLTAAGGGPGQAGTTGTIAGGVGGIASGGDVNNEGGDGGSALCRAGFTRATGGGSAGTLRGPGGDGGSITYDADVSCATGGGGVGGKGGSISNNQVVTTPGGGSSGPATDNALTPAVGRSGLASNYDEDGVQRMYSYWKQPLELTGGTGGTGGGSSGTAGGSPPNTGGICGGGGAASYGGIAGASGGLGGGGGGGYGGGGPGGNGFICVELIYA